MEKMLLRKGHAKAFFKVFIFLPHYLKFTIFNSFVPLAKLHLGTDYPVFCFNKPNIWPGTTGDYLLQPHGLQSLMYARAFHPAFLLPKAQVRSMNHRKSFKPVVKDLSEVQLVSCFPTSLKEPIINIISSLLCSIYSLLYCWSQLKINWNKYNLFRKVTIETPPENSL